jgi:peroxiredoxin
VEETGLPFHVLIDEDRSAAKAYGVWHRLGLDAWNTARPSVFLLDREGIVRALWVSDRQDEFPAAEEIEAELRTLSQGGRG